MVGTVATSQRGAITVTWSDSGTTVLTGAFASAGISAGTPIVLQELDPNKVVAFVNGKAVHARTLRAEASVPLNRAVNADEIPPAPPAIVPLATLMQLAYSGGTPCSEDGQMLVSIIEGQTGKPLSGAKVRLYGPTPAQYVSGPSGKIIFLHLHIGTYAVQIIKTGYTTLTSSGFSVNCSKATQLNFALASTAAWVTGNLMARMSPTAVQQLLHSSSLCVRTSFKRRQQMSCSQAIST
jgi:hypothetical protein